ncbi:hypothetical protein [Planctomonas psychrotolerans]|uniref:hypothetical protein n=1 Tax=Planctomonas psychrotolerans TaxID=2528712 RepID=UPI00123C04DA|nr:hypothetical protein [Planctomonas psychrotolerans]
MTTRLTVTAAPAAKLMGDVAQVIASLPVSLHHAPEAQGADLVGIAGNAGWAAEAIAAIGAGARGVMIIDPVGEDVGALIDAAAAARVPVVIDSTWSHNPAVASGAGAFTEQHSADSFVESRVNAPVGSDIDRVLLNQLALVRAAVGPVRTIRFARRNGTGYDALATLASGASAGLSGILSDSVPVSASLRILRSETAAELTLPGPETATPGQAVVSGPDGATLLPTLWETAHRAAWRRLHSLVIDGGTSDDLAGFAEDVAATRAAS